MINVSEERKRIDKLPYLQQIIEERALERRIKEEREEEKRAFEKYRQEHPELYENVIEHECEEDIEVLSAEEFDRREMAAKKRLAETQTELIKLTKESSDNEIRLYFEKVRELHKSGEQFPVDLDLVWMLVYEHKHKAIETLKENFIQMTESQSLTQKGERLNDNELQNGFDYKVVKERVRAGHTFSIKEKYHLSVSCMEHFIVRKVRHVFDVFKDIFYKPVDEPVPRTSIKTGLIQVFSYNNENVTMKMDNEFVYVNATEMAKTFNTKPANWLRTEQSERLIFALTVSHKCDTADLVKVVQGGNEQGTWFHEEVALIFAQWLSPEFYILCNRKIKELLTKGYAKLENISRKDLAKMLYESEVEKEEMQIEIGRRDEKIGKLAPKAECYERIQPTFGSMSIRQVAKVAGTGEKRLFKLLRDKHILTHNNEPYQRYLDAGYFEMSYNDYEDNNGREHSYFQTRVTGKGLPFVCKIVDENK